MASSRARVAPGSRTAAVSVISTMSREAMPGRAPRWAAKVSSQSGVSSVIGDRLIATRSSGFAARWSATSSSMRASNSGTSPPRSSPGRIAPALTIVPSPARMRSSASRKATARDPASTTGWAANRMRRAFSASRTSKTGASRGAGAAPRLDGIVHHEGLRERALCRGERLLGARQESRGDRWHGRARSRRRCAARARAGRAAS